MKESKTGKREPIEEFPKDNRLIFLEKNENVIAICVHKNCEGIIFVGSSKTQIGNRVLLERLRDHREFYGVEHEIDVIFPKENKIVDSWQLENIQEPEHLNPELAFQRMVLRRFEKEKYDPDNQ